MKLNADGSLDLYLQKVPVPPHSANQLKRLLKVPVALVGLGLDILYPSSWLDYRFGMLTTLCYQSIVPVRGCEQILVILTVSQIETL